MYFHKRFGTYEKSTEYVRMYKLIIITVVHSNVLLFQRDTLHNNFKNTPEISLVC